MGKIQKRMCGIRTMWAVVDIRSKQVLHLHKTRETAEVWIRLSTYWVYLYAQTPEENWVVVETSDTILSSTQESLVCQQSPPPEQ